MKNEFPEYLKFRKEWLDQYNPADPKMSASDTEIGGDPIIRAKDPKNPMARFIEYVSRTFQANDHYWLTAVEETKLLSRREHEQDWPTIFAPKKADTDRVRGSIERYKTLVEQMKLAVECAKSKNVYMDRWPLNIFLQCIRKGESELERMKKIEKDNQVCVIVV